VERRHGRRKPEFLHPRLKEILGDTYGVMVYQEQVMEIAQALAGSRWARPTFSGRRWEEGRRLMERQKARFLEGAKGNGIPEAKAVAIFD